MKKYNPKNMLWHIIDTTELFDTYGSYGIANGNNETLASGLSHVHYEELNKICILHNEQILESLIIGR